MELSPQLDAYSERARRMSEEFHTPMGREYSKNHDLHGSHPIFKESGWGRQSPCSYSECPHHDEAFTERLQDAEMARLHETRMISPQQFAPQLHPLEPVVDHAAIARYAANPDTGHKSPPVAAELPGYPGLHVLDGHHRLLAAQKTGRAIAVRVKSG